MPEIYECFYGLFQLARLFPKTDKQFEEEIKKYEYKTQCDMAEIRLRLFTDFGYC